ncbi:MAG: hypothetical protein HKO59_01600 [Phycisphaerales bacterium]|nr:hypothetical protein [Phycisphaerae bacterium]NNF44335.1 hypothetical protein [Phycisphaerales bacterium]NNM24676.1 hypothetical protein [Phycisphaerales bacterium]
MASPGSRTPGPNATVSTRSTNPEFIGSSSTSNAHIASSGTKGRSDSRGVHGRKRHAVKCHRKMMMMRLGASLGAMTRMARLVRIEIDPTSRMSRVAARRMRVRLASDQSRANKAMPTTPRFRSLPAMAITLAAVGTVWIMMTLMSVSTSAKMK